MNRIVALAVVALMAVTGCATGVEDPQPPPPSPTPANPPAVQTFSSEEVDTSKPDPTIIGNGGLDAPVIENLEPVPVNGIDTTDGFRESDSPKLDPSAFEAPIPVNG